MNCLLASREKNTNYAVEKSDIFQVEIAFCAFRCDTCGEHNITYIAFWPGIHNLHLNMEIPEKQK